MNEEEIKVILDKHEISDADKLAKALAEILPRFENPSTQSISEELAFLSRTESRGGFNELF